MMTGENANTAIRTKTVRASKKLTSSVSIAQKNGIPDNPKCSWPYEILCRFYHDIVLIEIDALESAKRGADARKSDNGDDGGNGSEEIYSNSKASNVPEMLMEAAQESKRYAEKKEYLVGVKNAIEEGRFSCVCDDKTFYVKNIL